MKKSNCSIYEQQAILLTAFAGCGKEKAAETSTTAQTSENTTNEVTKVTSGNALSIPTDELSENAEFLPGRCRRHRNGSDCSKRFPQEPYAQHFNTCQICYDSGKGYYKQEGDKLVCQNCGNSFTMDQVGEISRGCDPWPILDENKTVTDEEIEISYDFLKDSADIFANWKKA